MGLPSRNVVSLDILSILSASRGTDVHREALVAHYEPHRFTTLALPQTRLVDG